MSNSNMLISFSLSLSLFFFFISFASSSSFNVSHKCSPQQALDLLLFKQNISSINHSYHGKDDIAFQDDIDSDCHNWLGSDYHPIMMNWNKNTDCCKWDGVTCNHFTGDVIGIDLSCGMLRGTIHPNSTLFHLPRLQSLNLAYNNFAHTQLPREIHKLSNSLTHLNLSVCWFTGYVPWEILFLPKLVSLDLYSDNQMQMHPYVLKNLLQNSTQLRELLLNNVHIGRVLPTYLNISSSLKSLDLSWTGLQGILPNNIFNLQYLEKLDLSGNYYLTGALPQANTSNNIPLKWLDLSTTNLSGEIPNSFGHLKSLNYLELDSCGLVGSLPNSLANLTHLTTLVLSNNKLNGTLPSFLFTLPLLENLFLGINMFTGSLPSKLFNSQSLKRLSLGSNKFDANINITSTPASFIQLLNLTSLDLSYNNFTGLWDLNTLLSSLPNLQTLDLSNSGLTIVTNNGTNYVNSNFQELGLASCKLTVFPKSLRAMKNLRRLDLSNNDIHGRIPGWVGEIGGSRLSSLDLSNNFITGLPQVQWDLQTMFLQSNQIQGPFPPSICSMRNLGYLDISNNSFSGVIPQCFGNIISFLEMVDMGNNDFHGIIPDVYEKCGYLQGLILNGNRLHGEIPISLSKCQYLNVLDLGNNQLNGTFPHWLGDLPMLQVLVLKSNKLHGPIETPSPLESAFPSMRVFVLSDNEFVGLLPQNYLQNFNAMKNAVKDSTTPRYVDMGGKYYSVTIAVKGVDLEFLKISVDYIIVDLSKNIFKGEIPGVVGSLTSLIVLNLSHNSLTGQIPSVLGNLSEMESLDLSCNRLTGEIPQSLAGLTFLGFLNLSENHLVGRIPSGTQFTTFGNSFGGNPELCGPPLPKKCGKSQETQPEVGGDEDGDGESRFTWRVVMMGYGCGTILGLVMGYLMLSTGRPKWFNAIADGGYHMIQTRQNTRR